MLEMTVVNLLFSIDNIIVLEEIFNTIMVVAIIVAIVYQRQRQPSP
jgi:hypothetical protein